MKIVGFIIGIIALGCVTWSFAEMPHNFKGKYDGTSIKLTWAYSPFINTNSQRIYRKTQYSDFVIRTNLPAAITNYSDFKIEQYCFYSYKIVLVGNNGLERESSTILEIGAMTNVSQYYDLIRFENNSASAGGSIKLHYSLPTDGDVEIAILNTARDVLNTFNLGSQTAGTYAFTWDLKNANQTPVQPGMYVISLKAGTQWEYKKVVIKR